MDTAAPSAMPASRRSWRRWLLVGGFVLLLAATPFIFSRIGRWQADREMAALHAEIDADDPNWRWPDLLADLPEPPPDQENAALELIKVADLVKKKPVRPPTVFLARSAPAANIRPSADKVKALRKGLANFQPEPLGAARKLKDMPRGQLRIEAVENPLEAKLPDSLLLMAVMQMLLDDAALRAEDDDLAGSAESSLALLNAANAVGDAPVMMVQLVRQAGQQAAVAAVMRLLGQGEAPKDALQNLQAALEREAGHNGLALAMRGERAFAHQIHVLLQQGKLSVTKDLGGYRPSRIPTFILDAFPSLLVGDYASNLRFQTALVSACKKGDKERADALDDLEIKGPSTALYFLVGLAKDALETQALLRCAATGVAAERYRLAHGRWPDDAAHLVAGGFLKAAYNDPFDGQPLRWRHTNAGLVIYSIGKDRIDDSAGLERHDHRVAVGDVGFVLWNPPLRRAEPAAVEKSE
jgi:hypothetical protein